MVELAERQRLLTIQVHDPVDLFNKTPILVPSLRYFGDRVSEIEDVHIVDSVIYKKGNWEFKWIY